MGSTAIARRGRLLLALTLTLIRPRGRWEKVRLVLLGLLLRRRRIVRLLVLALLVGLVLPGLAGLRLVAGGGLTRRWVALQRMGVAGISASGSGEVIGILPWLGPDGS